MAQEMGRTVGPAVCSLQRHKPLCQRHFSSGMDQTCGIQMCTKQLRTIQGLLPRVSQGCS